MRLANVQPLAGIGAPTSDGAWNPALLQRVSRYHRTAAPLTLHLSRSDTYCDSVLLNNRLWSHYTFLRTTKSSHRYRYIEETLVHLRHFVSLLPFCQPPLRSRCYISLPLLPPLASVLLFTPAYPSVALSESLLPSLSSAVSSP
jgi:hypothetical protein